MRIISTDVRLKISPLNPKTMNEKLEDKERSTTLQSQHKKLESKLKRETFLKLGLGIFQNQRENELEKKAMILTNASL